MTSATIHVGDSLAVLRTLPAASVHCCVTSPPYWGLRDYGVDGQIGLEETFDEFLARLVAVFDEVRRVLRDDGVAWVNMGDAYCQAHAGGDTYSGTNSRTGRSVGRNGKQAKVAGAFPAAATRSVPGLKSKDLIGQPWRLAFALQAAGWWLRSDCIWHKPNPMPESVTDRPTKSHEYVFLLTKSARYFYDLESIREPVSQHNTGEISVAPHGEHVATQGHRQQERRRYDEIKGANCRTVWTIPPQAFDGAHFATFPEALAERCIRAATSEKGCCAKCGAPWRRVVKPTAEYAEKLGRRSPHSGTLGDHGKTNRGSGLADQGGLCAAYETVGWGRSCECAAVGGLGAPDRPYLAVPCTVLDPFTGSGTTGAVALKLGRSFVGVELNPDYAELARRRIDDVQPLFTRAKVAQGAQ